MGLLSSLNREQKETIGLLQIGTFLEYFDFMLFIHMAVLLNELFFPPAADPRTASLQTAFAFCSAYVFRPIGALIFGWIGDRIGRKKTIIVTTTMMAVSCVVMANLPTYAQMGIFAAWVLTACRALQAMSSMGELVGAEIYLAETFHRPASYPIAASLNIFSGLGGVAALGVATLVTSSGFNWRLAFWGGALIAIVTAVARRRLRETPDFLEMKRKLLKEGIHQMNLEVDPIEGAKVNATWKEPVNSKTLASYFGIYCAGGLTFYLAYVYFNPILKESFGYSSSQIIRHNFLLSIVYLISFAFMTYLSSKIHPIRILKVRGTLALFLMIFLPFLIMNPTSPSQLLLIQALIILIPLNATPGEAVFLSHFPLYRRVTYATLLFAFSHALAMIVTSFGLVYLVNYYGHFGILLISLPMAFFYLCGLLHFEGLERKRKLYPNLSR